MSFVPHRVKCRDLPDTDGPGCFFAIIRPLEGGKPLNPRSIRRKAAAAALFLGVWMAGNAIAQDTDVQSPAAPKDAATEGPAVPLPAPVPAPGTTDAGCCSLADGTIVELEIAEPISSKTAQRGQRFKLALASPLYAGDVMLLPAGTEGIGEVVHADRARAAGKPGELILAGRSLNGPGGDIKLRGFRMGGSGENRTVAAFWIPLGFLMRGGQIEIPPGARAHAKLAGPHWIPPSTAAAAAAPAAAIDPPAVSLPSPVTAPTAPAAEDGTESSPPSP